MQSWTRLLRAFGLNAIPLGGLIAAQWASGTVLAVYWLETVLAIPFVAGRIVLHRRATRASGHDRAHFASGAESGTKRGSLLGETLLYSVVFSAAHGLFLAVFLLGLLPRAEAGAAIDPATVGTATLAALAVLALSFFRDAVGIGLRSFAWVKEEARALLGRTVVVHLAIIGGVWLAAATDRPASFLLVFGGLKLLTDVATAWPRRPAKAEAPSALVTMMNRLPAARDRGGDFAAFYRQQLAAGRALAEQDEVPAAPLAAQLRK